MSYWQMQTSSVRISRKRGEYCIWQLFWTEKRTLFEVNSLHGWVGIFQENFFNFFVVGEIKNSADMLFDPQKLRFSLYGRIVWKSQSVHGSHSVSDQRRGLLQSLQFSKEVLWWFHRENQTKPHLLHRWT